VLVFVDINVGVPMEFSRSGTRLPKTPKQKQRWKRAIVILEHCPLEQVQTATGGWELLSDKHKRILAQRNIDPADFRPDVVHQCLLHLLDCPLNRAGMLQIFIRTHKGVLISVDPRMHVPRSPRLFSKMMAMLLFKLKVRAAQSTSRIALMKVVKNPLTDHLPSNTKFFRVERDGELIEPFKFAAELGAASTAQMKGSHIGTNGVSDLAAAKRHRTETSDVAAENVDASDDDDDDIPEDPVWQREAAASAATSEEDAFHPFAFVIGGVSRGDVKVEYADQAKTIKLANRGMSAAAAVSLLCHAFEEAWINAAV
jgi:rRNA small subunit pseudouridine methyltransferase Nep1